MHRIIGFDVMQEARFRVRNCEIKDDVLNV